MDNELRKNEEEMRKKGRARVFEKKMSAVFIPIGRISLFNGCHSYDFLPSPLPHPPIYSPSAALFILTEVV